MKTSKEAINGNKEEILSARENMKEGERICLRRLTPRECMKFMGVDECYIDRWQNPAVELAKMGKDSHEIDQLMTVDGKKIKLSDRDLYKLAGNSIVVDTLYHVFENLFCPNTQASENDDFG